MSSKDYYFRTRCRMCDGDHLEKVMELTPTPPGNNFLKKEEIDTAEPCYPLDLYFCDDCHHVQLGHVVDPKILYQNNYPYVSATSSQFVRHLNEYADAMVERFALQPGSLVADIGSNDGTCLRAFKQHGMKVLGVDPAENIAEAATAAGIETIGQFFSLKLAQQLKEQYGAAKFITSHNACAHIDQLDGVMRGVAHWLDDGGVFVLEVGYLVDVYSNLWFDTIYHEHCDYHTVGPFEKLFERTGLELVAVQRVSPQGGSIRIMAQKAGGNFKRDESILQLMDLEVELGLDQPSTFALYLERINVAGKGLRTLIRSIKAENKSIAAYGATTKSTTMLAQFGVNADSIDFIVDDNPLKQGLFSPRLHIPVVPTGELYRRRPDYVLVLAWNFAEPIMAMHKAYAEQGGRFILPMPTPRIV